MQKKKIPTVIHDERLLQNQDINITPQVPKTMSEAKKLYQNCSATTIEANEQIISIVDELNKLEELKKQLQEKENNLKLDIMNYMQMHHYLKAGDTYLVSWKSVNRKTFDLFKFKDELPDLYTSYLRESTARAFRLH